MNHAPGLTFCIVTAGKRPELLATAIRSIRAQGMPAFEILVVGRHRDELGLRYLAAEQAADDGRLGAMRNLAVAQARHEWIVMLDDDIVLAPDWHAQLGDACERFDIVTSQVRVPDGSRYWDHASFGGPLGHRLLDAEEHDAHLYMTGGGGWMMRRAACERVGWDERRGLYENEDVDFSQRCRAAGLRIGHRHASIVYHVAPQYTAVGRAVFRRSDGREADWVESLRERTPAELVREIQRWFHAGSVAELADVLRFACRTHPGVAPFRQAWSELEASHGGALRDARWSSGMDPALRAALERYAGVREAEAPRANVRESRAPLGINLFGFLTGNLGLGVAARAYLRLLVERGIAVHGVDVQVSDRRHGHERSLPASVGSSSDPAPHDVNVFLMNPQDIAMLQGARAVNAGAKRLQACVPFWELPQIPPSWLAELERMDVIAAPSQLIRHALFGAVAGPRIAYWPLPVYVPEGAVADRRRFGLEDDEVVFMSAFEMASDINRKNPLGAMEAFRRAFPAGERVRLIIKVNNGFASFELLHALVEIAKRDPRILVVDKVMSYADVLSLYASADAFVSLHRAEGFGLCMAEAMCLGVPVIATAWSGNMDFMSERNACLVRYALAPVQAANQAAYLEPYTGAGARWAEPDLDEAARWMRRLADDPELRTGIGKAAAADMAARQAALGVDELMLALARARELRTAASIRLAR
jgi:glycosyltransferase involved in cell wall biosynthesis